MTGMRRKQKGLSTLGWLVTILVASLGVIVVLKLTPLYLDDYAVSRVLISLDNKSSIEKSSLPEVRDWLNKGLQTNLIKLDTKEVRVYRDNRDQVSIDIDYERRLNLIRNVDFIVSFEHDWKVKSQ